MILKRHRLAAAVLAAHLGLALPLSAQALELDIPRQSLESALVDLAEQANVRLFYSAELTRGLQSAKALKGDYALDVALEQLLYGSGLRWQLGEDGSVTLAPALESALMELETTSIIAGQGMGESTEHSRSYTTGLVSVGSKTPTSLRETPQAVSVITSQLIQDRHLTDLADAMSLAPGITSTHSNSRMMAFYSRGFAIQSIQVDGAMPMAFNGQAGSFYSGKVYDLAEYDHVEILRGSASLFAGAADPGGMISLVRKRALPEFQAKFDVSAGSWDNYRTQVDVTGPLVESGAVRGRVVTAYTDKQYFVDRRSTEKNFIYGVLEMDIAPETMLTVGGSYERVHENGAGTGLPRYSDGRDLKLSRSTSLTQNWSYQDLRSQELFVKVDHALSDNWKLNSAYTYTHDSNNGLGGFGLNAVNPVTLKGPIWLGSYTDSKSKQTLFDLNLSGFFDAFGHTHELLVGADWQRVTSQWRGAPGPSGKGGSVDVFNVGSTPWNHYPVSKLFYERYDPNTQVQYGAYSKLVLQLSDPLKVVIGGRLARYKFEQKVHDAYTAPNGSWQVSSNIAMREPTHFVPYAGVIYALDSQWSLYSSYSEIFRPQQSLLKGPETSGVTVDAMTGKTYEAGVKGELLDGKLNVSAAIFHTKREDGAVRDNRYQGSSVLFGGSCCYLNQGEVISKGFELEASGEMLPGLQGIASYTYNNNEDRSSGAPLSTITPKHSVKLWGVWQLPGQLARWRTGAGVNVQSATYVSGLASRFDSNGQEVERNIPFDYSQSGYAVWSALLEYQVDEHWSLGLNGNNLLDRRYYQTVGSASNGNYYGEPRNFVLSLSGTF
ncbi:TonB-dependent siderophore receptor [Pseudomonas sp. ABC1]|uniref:TonB-dependent siderophore receptor n=1 Tax=Pseudomonas sp. ABC1 TaxID=2748080 RepID=UPI0015C3ADA7|nr:TonB-dependent receptor [Pseudomonas sp. ABC1]QLF94229.1 TonB-dependent siderophore receptor [Pseudomonas sp. ABC1]